MSEPDDKPIPSIRYESTRVRGVEIIISTLLRAGVMLSLALVVFGTVLSFVHHPEFFHSKTVYQRLIDGGPAFPHSIQTVLAGTRAFRGQAWILAGLLLLIATPVLRVAVSVFIFVYQRDRIFVIFTLIVLTFLLLSFFLGKTAG